MSSYQKRLQELTQLREYAIKLEQLAINLMENSSLVIQATTDRHLLKHAFRIRMHEQNKHGVVDDVFLFDSYKEITE